LKEQTNWNEQTETYLNLCDLRTIWEQGRSEWYELVQSGIGFQFQTAWKNMFSILNGRIGFRMDFDFEMRNSRFWVDSISILNWVWNDFEIGLERFWTILGRRWRKMDNMQNVKKGVEQNEKMKKKNWFYFK
jgi:hypothetical protein